MKETLIRIAGAIAFALIIVGIIIFVFVLMPIFLQWLDTLEPMVAVCVLAFLTSIVFFLFITDNSF